MLAMSISLFRTSDLSHNINNRLWIVCGLLSIVYVDPCTMAMVLKCMMATRMMATRMMVTRVMVTSMMLTCMMVTRDADTRDVDMYDATPMIR